MVVDKSSSFIMAQRLKELRNKKGLSHESLRKALMEKYEIDISVDSLKNYEVSTDNHKKAYKNDGMRVEYLRYLADFYDVSADYILGLTPTKSRNILVRDIVELTGLSEQSIEHLAKTKRIQQQEEITPAIEEAIEEDLRLEKKRLEFLLYEIAEHQTAEDIPEDIKDIMASANISDLQNSKDYIIQTGLQNRRAISLENNSHYEALMIEAINHLIENEDTLRTLHKIALYLYSSQQISKPMFRICEAGLSHQYFPLGVDIVSTSFLSEIDDSLKKLREQTGKKYDITTF